MRNTGGRSGYRMEDGRGCGIQEGGGGKRRQEGVGSEGKVEVVREGGLYIPRCCGSALGVGLDLCSWRRGGGAPSDPEKQRHHEMRTRINRSYKTRELCTRLAGYSELPRALRRSSLRQYSELLTSKQ
jgi:hypothetical protein